MWSASAEMNWLQLASIIELKIVAFCTCLEPIAGSPRVSQSLEKMTLDVI